MIRVHEFGRIDKAALFADLGYQPHAGQKLIHDSSARFRVVACGARFGKTVCAALEAIAAALQPGQRTIIWCVAPTYDLADRVFREIEVVVLEHLRHRLIAKREAERRILIRNLAGGTSEIRAKSADNPDSLLGEGLDLVIVDEAARLKPRIWQAHLSQRLVDKQGGALLISTPRGKGWLFDLFRRGQNGTDPDYASWNMPSWINPLLDPAIIEAERARLPDRVFAQEYAAEFIEGAGAVFRNVRESATGVWQEPVPGERYFAGLDLAKVEDFSVLVVVNAAREVVYVDRFHRIDWSVQAARIQGAAKRFNNARVYVDTTGVGDPIFEALRKAGVQVEAYPFTAKSKSALIENLTLMLEERQLVLPQPSLWPEGIDELEAYEYATTDSGHVRTSSPSGMHDDCVVALALAAWAVRKPPAEFYFRICGTRRAQPTWRAMR